ncbi:MAG: hypothetical protein ACI37O_00125 [Candidatus Avelusimicrobium sp.]|uniref:hypothetical protein n=1 Tax=Candidatus Avelusimicrobium sp. TaxID=3048833 RepID=UPI003F0C68B3
MKVNAKEYVKETSKQLYDMTKETRDSQRAMMQILIPLNATILIGILGLANAFSLGNSILSTVLTLLSCVCFLISLLAFVFAFGDMLIHLSKSIYDMLESFIEAGFAILDKKTDIEVENPRLFINPAFVIIGFVCFALGMLNIAWAFVLRFNNICICWILCTNLALLGGIVWLLYPFLKRNVSLESLVKNAKTKYEKTI